MKVLKKNGFARSVGVLVGGTVAAHLVTALALPISTRLYSPEDFSVLAVFASLLSIISVAACLRFDIAVSIAKSDDDAVNLLTLALACALSVALCLALVVLILPGGVLEYFNLTASKPYLWLLPPGVFLAAAYGALQLWFVRKKEFGLIARSRVAQSLASVGTQVGCGIAGIAPLGLLVGYMLNTGAGCVMLGVRLYRLERQLLGAISWAQMRAMFFAYSRFPKFSTLEALSNSAAIQVPVIIIAAMAAGPEAGYLTLAMYVMQAPMALIGNAIGQVYLSRAPKEYRDNALGMFTGDILGGLLKTGTGPLVFAGIVAPDAFAVIFGEEWRRAGVLVSWMTPWFVMQYLATPMSMALHVTGNQRAAFGLQVFGLLSRIGSVWAASFILSRPFAEAYAVSGFLFYFLYLAFILYYARTPYLRIARGVRNSIVYLFSWASIGVVLSLIGLQWFKNILTWQ